MPSTVVHVALAGLVAAALLGDAFDRRSLLVVLAAVAFIDLDAVLGIWLPGTHRAAFHTLLLPLVAGTLIYYDARVRERSWLRARFDGHGARVASVTAFAVAFAGVGPDVFFNGVNLLYPLHDRFYDLSGEAFLSNQRGFVQTFVEPAAREGTTAETHYSTGVDPSRGAEPENVERIFPLVRSGQQLLLVLTSAVVTGVRLWEARGERAVDAAESAAEPVADGGE